MADRFDIGVSCSLGVGPERGGREWNEDNFLVFQQGIGRWRDGQVEATEAVSGEGVMVAVADGMGGHARGDIASLAAVRALLHLVRAGAPDEPERALLRFVQHAHGRLYEQAAAQGAGKMGTTLTVAWIVGGVASWVHVGDSRLYLQRGEGLIQITRDQTRAELARRDGRPPPRDPDALVQGFVFGSRGLGDDRRLRLDPGHDTGTVRLAVGDRLLLCSDGLHGAVNDADLSQALADAATAGAAASALVDLAMERGSDDNITALVLSVDELERREQAPGAPLVDVQTLVPLE